mmetsp:Transcript_11477/g.18891  ORF Transcript_11477/g.18891 Transcript_11477/m.18891 type:complete len:217 (+) Transcript_11477:514-1164(+)
MRVYIVLRPLRQRSHYLAGGVDFHVNGECLLNAPLPHRVKRAQQRHQPAQRPLRITAVHMLQSSVQPLVVVLHFITLLRQRLGHKLAEVRTLPQIMDGHHGSHHLSGCVLGAGISEGFGCKLPEGVKGLPAQRGFPGGSANLHPHIIMTFQQKLASPNRTQSSIVLVLAGSPSQGINFTAPEYIEFNGSSLLYPVDHVLGCHGAQFAAAGVPAATL